MSRWLSIFFLVCCAASAAADPIDYRADVLPIVQSHCVKCHGEKAQKADIRLDTLATNFIEDRAAAETWHEALNAIRRGDMPPEDQQPLSDEQRKILTEWIETNLQMAIAARTSPVGGVVMRRLNRSEYQYTMTDLLGLEMDYAAELPPDSLSADGFRNNGSVLGMSGLQLENYLNSARRAMGLILVEGEQPPRITEKLSSNSGGVKGKQYLGKASDRLGRVNFWHGTFKEVPRSGPFTIRITARAERTPNQPVPVLLASYGYFVSGLTVTLMDEVCEIDIPSTESTVYEITGRAEFFPLPEAHVPKGNLNGLVVLQNVLQDGKPLPKQIEVESEVGKGKKKQKKKGKEYPEDPDFPKIIIESVEFVGNDYPSWPSPLHQQIVPNGEDLASAESVAGVLSSFLSRAWRRPITDDELTTWQSHFQAIRAQSESDMAALRETLAASLASSHFLYLTEPQANDTAGRKLTAHEVAARLSYFLWSSLPDAPLRAAADSGELLNPAELRKQFTRMLADEKSVRFSREFSTFWLDLNAVDRVAINPQYYGNFDEELKPDMVRESQEFFREILQSGSSALSFLDADFTMANAVLAKHYGLTGPRSQRFERVALHGQRPGGLLGHASVHLSGSDGADSHPIKRAVWIRERLLNDPPKPPPPDVPDLKKSVPDLAKLTIREQLAVHREKAACADCHRSIDPWGIALEHYDAIGLWRDQSARSKTKISAETVLPGNHPVSGVEDLQKHLTTDRRDQFVRSLVSKLLTYALGRSLAIEDEPLIEQLSQKFAENNYQLAALMEEIVVSETFLSR